MNAFRACFAQNDVSPRWRYKMERIGVMCDIAYLFSLFLLSIPPRFRFRLRLRRVQYENRLWPSLQLIRTIAACLSALHLCRLQFVFGFYIYSSTVCWLLETFHFLHRQSIETDPLCLLSLLTVTLTVTSASWVSPTASVISFFLIINHGLHPWSESAKKSQSK